jgi:YlmC/YmxH family sporulation protein
MIRTSDLAEKEVITLKDGRNLGPISDIELDLEQGIVEAIVVPGQGKFLGFFARENDIVIPWNSIVNIGIDVILVNLKDVIEPGKNEAGSDY